jgi:hypothetical protein
MKNKLSLMAMLLFVGLFTIPQDAFSQFNRNAAIWFPSESADYNEAFKRAFLDIEAYISSTGATEITTSWIIDNEGNLTHTVFGVAVTSAAQDTMGQMIAWYVNLAATCSTCSADYKLGLEDGATTWYGMPLVWN